MDAHVTNDVVGELVLSMAAYGAKSVRVVLARDDATGLTAQFMHGLADCAAHSIDVRYMVTRFKRFGAADLGVYACDWIYMDPSSGEDSLLVVDAQGDVLWTVANIGRALSHCSEVKIIAVASVESEALAGEIYRHFPADVAAMIKIIKIPGALRSSGEGAVLDVDRTNDASMMEFVRNRRRMMWSADSEESVGTIIQ